MGYCGIKISGHTGTDFKHKKVFTKPKEILNHERKIINVKIEPREQDKPFAWFFYFKVVIVFVSIITIFLIISFLASGINNVAIHKTHISTIYLKKVENNQKKEAAEMMYRSAKSYYNSGGLHYAQEEITRVLRLYPTHIDALNLMHKILVAQCAKNNLYCKEAKEYQDYLALAN